MSDAAWISLFAAVPPSLLALASLLQVLKARRDQNDLKREVNSRMTDLVNEVRGRAAAEAKLEIIAPTALPAPAPEQRG